MATFLLMPLLPFHFVSFTQALQRLPPATVRNCVHLQSCTLIYSISTDNEVVSLRGSWDQQGPLKEFQTPEVRAGRDLKTFLLNSCKYNKRMQHLLTEKLISVSISLRECFLQVKTSTKEPLVPLVFHSWSCSIQSTAAFTHYLVVKCW